MYTSTKGSIDMPAIILIQFLYDQELGRFEAF